MSSGGDNACGEKGKRGETRERAAPGNERMFTGGEVSYRGNYSQPASQSKNSVRQSFSQFAYQSAFASYLLN